MKIRHLLYILFFAQIVFASENLPAPATAMPRPPLGALSRGPAPIISVNEREMLITLPEADNMRITIFTPSGRRLTRKRVAGETITFRLPRSARKEIIVQIEASALRFFSQSVVLK
ncbi:MAG: hypothetical protein FWE23_10380 [Chitinivibrionia bacterium]|nr:hypothetical protein [Chitinivibrionia bacterium]